MAYVALNLQSPDAEVNAFIKRVIEPYLVEAHYLLTATRPCDDPSGHFPYACAMMLLGTVSATSALDNFQRTGQKRRGDGKHFLDCLRRYFPWDRVTIDDGEHRPESERREAACCALYEVFRCPLVHSAGLVDSSAVGAALVKVHPGHRDIEVAERRVEELAQAQTLKKQCLIKLEFKKCTLYIDAFYWCVRRMVKQYARDPQTSSRIRSHCQALLTTP